MAAKLTETEREDIREIIKIGIEEHFVKRKQCDL